MSRSNVGRNDPCPCGSGKKYKKCCLGKADNPEYSKIENFAEIYKVARKKARIKECIHPDKEHCSDRIIGAHSIQNNKILAKISDNGYLYMPCAKPDLQPGLQYKYGRKEATIFTGFCGFHDKITFQSIEDRDFIGTDEQVFLHIYRAFALEYHKKKEATRMMQLLFTEKPSAIHKNGMLKDGRTGFQMAVYDYEEDKKLFDQSIMNKKYDVLTYFIWTFDGFSNFAATGAEAPTEDFDGKAIQDLLDYKTPAYHIYLTVFPEKDKTYAIVAWLKREDELFASIKDKLLNLNEEEKRNFINNTITFSCENLVIKPSSWDEWPDGIKERFEEAFIVSMYASKIIGNMTCRLEKPPFDLFSL